MPSIESLEAHWVSWDEPLVSDKRVHWAICDREPFRHMSDASAVAGNICSLGDVNPQDPHLHLRMELHFLAPVEMLEVLEVLNRVHRTVRRHAVQIQRLAQQVTQMQMTFGGALEVLMEQHPELQPHLNLFMQPQDDGGSTMQPR